MTIYKTATTPGTTKAHKFFAATIATIAKHRATGQFCEQAALRLVTRNCRDFARQTGLPIDVTDAPRLLRWILRWVA